MTKEKVDYQAEKEKLLADHVKFSKAEDVAKARRLEVEAKIEELYPFKDGLSKTFKEDNFKVTVKKNFATKFDSDEYSKIRTSIPEELRPEKVKFELDKTGFDWLKENKPEIYVIVSNCVTIKQNKTTVTVEKI